MQRTSVWRWLILWRQKIGAIAAHADPLVETGNIISLVVAGNQPLYPFFVAWVVGHDWKPACMTLFSTPAFAFIPVIARRHPVMARLLLPLAGIANTILCTKVLGEATGVGFFLLPSALLAAALFRPRERLFSLIAIGLAFCTYIGLHGRYGEPFHAYTAAEAQNLLRMNAISAAALCIFTGFLLARIIARQESR